jgi:DNA-binding MarR family transcriptional regulator
MDTTALLARTKPSDLLELDNQLCFALHAATRQVLRAYRPVLAELGLTYSQYLVMLVLWAWDRENRARPTVSALGERLALDSGTLTPLLKRLESRHLIKRTRSSEDERELSLQLTAAGRKLEKPACKVPISLLSQSSWSLPEMLGLRDQLKRLRADLAAEELRRAGTA